MHLKAIAASYTSFLSLVSNKMTQRTIVHHRASMAWFILTNVVVLFVPVGLLAQKSSQPTFRRVEPPQFDKKVASSPFFGDAFAEALRGERPSDLGSAPQPNHAQRPPETTDESTSKYPWSEVISATHD